MNKLLKAISALALISGVMSAGGAIAQDKSDTIRVAMYTQASTRGDVYGKNYIWPHMYWWEGSYDSFVRVDDKGRTLPFAVKSWKNINPTTWQITFRDDITFWNGKKNTAENIGKTMNYLLNTDAGRAAGVLRASKLASYRVVGPQTLEIVTPKPDPIFMPKLAAFYVVDMAAFEDLGIGEFSKRPVASGPFEITSWSDQEQHSKAFAASWRPAKAKNMVIIEVPEAATRLAALQSGEVDIAFNLSPDHVPVVRAAGHTAAVESAPFVASMGLFTVDFANKWGGKPPFADKRVRQAANYALNKDAMVGQLLGGLGKPASQPAVPTTFGYNSDLKPYPYDPEKAKRLLAEAGYPNGFDILMETSGVFGAAGDIFQVMASDLAKVGINVTINVMPFSERTKLFNGNSWKGDITSFTSFFSPPQDASIPFSVYGCDLPNTFTCIPKLTPLIKAQANEMDPEKRLEILKELMKLSNEEALALYLFEGFDITGVSKRIAGYKNWNKVIHYENMSIIN
ncbi:MAG: ABC transporter substrate-binding protein [Proteobacteria bacterium]|nr:ABC transporter substrate-binding protein [Pseudomonadota bacterium]